MQPCCWLSVLVVVVCSSYGCVFQEAATTVSPMTVSADAALLLAQQHQQQQSEAAAVSAAAVGISAGISLDDGYMKDDAAASFMKVDDSTAAAADASEYLKDAGGDEHSAGLTDSASGLK